ncbi:MAG: hypothetical protein CXZ00_10720 [Acidobacteria bacterium]|nr:MAG: hypothetical protein CXZ00_10720 [Acidobacteriota bacterium]
MNTNQGHENGDERYPSVAYDKSDLSARGILIFFIVLAVGAVVIHVGVLVLYLGLTKIVEKHETELSPLAPKVAVPRFSILSNITNVNIQQFPEPRLESDATANMTKFLNEETAALTAAPWQDSQGNVHLPIDQAIKIVATRLPTRANSVAPPIYPGAGRAYANQNAPQETAAQQMEAGRNGAENPPAGK